MGQYVEVRGGAGTPPAFRGVIIPFGNSAVSIVITCSGRGEISEADPEHCQGA